ncbi:hypothetical protein [Spiroplasma endosymbiont of Polydrusus pterygomalis]|uniref:hypothetical protein n=1 Tax=Spiroplasma endosymbiont of Polydrusus pterygomalis TaxID=3139327 RepID=UPI003CCA8242
MEKSSQFNKLAISQGIKYCLSETNNLKFNIVNLSVEKAVKNWSFEGKYPTCLAIFSNDEDNNEKLINALAGNTTIIEGKILINDLDVTYNSTAFERKIVYVSMQLQGWNKLFSIQHNLARTAFANKPFLQEISNFNQKIKIDIENLKNTGLNLDSGYFKDKLINIIINFINETQSTRDNFIKEYQYQINHFHKNFAKEKFNFPGSEKLIDILIKKFTAEEANIIANNNLLFLQSLQDRISSLESLVGPCFCGCKPPRERKSEFQLREITFVIKEINNYLNREISATRSEIRTTLKTCNNYNQSFNNELNHLLSYQQIKCTRGQIDQTLEQWIDLAEVQRIKFNMKQDFVAMQLLPDEMYLLLKNIKDEIKIYHDKILKDPELQDKEIYQQQLHTLYSQLVDVRDLIGENIVMIFENLELSHLLPLRLTKLTIVERQLIKIIQQLIVPTKVLILHNPFELLNNDNKEQLANWIKKLQKFLKIIIFFTTNNQVDINLLATDVTVIENEIIIQQGNVSEIITKPLSLNLLKEMNEQHINIAKGVWNAHNLYFYDVNLGKFNKKTASTIAFKSNSILFSIKKPKFTFFKNTIIIKGVIKNITEVNEKEAYLSIETANGEEFEVLTNNNNNFEIGTIGWMSITKNSIFVFDDETKQLIGTW